MASIVDRVRHLPEQILATIKKYNMLEGGNKVLVSVSGGPDSVALLHLLYSLRVSCDLQLHVFHLDHQVRGENSAKDALFVQKLARSLNLPVSSLSHNIPGYIFNKSLCLQEAAREIRYQLLDEVADEIGADKIAVGHNADDQVETFLMRIIRGTGPCGLRGIPPVRGRIIRPLIEVSREEIEEYLDVNEIEFRVDSSNLKPDYLRNRIRHQLIPLFLEQNERFKENVLNTIALISEDEAFLEQSAKELFEAIAHRDDERALVCQCPKLLSLPPAMQRRVVRMALGSIKGNLREIEYRHVNIILAAVEKGRSDQIDLPGGIVVLIEYGNLVFALSEERKKAISCVKSSIELKIPGITEIPYLDMEIRAKIKCPDKVNPSAPQNREKAYLDLDKLTLPLQVRTRFPGDRFVPLGMSGEKKLQDFLVDKKVSKRKRDRIPIVECQGQIVWVGKMAIDDRVKVMQDTEKVVVLEIK